MSRRILNPLVLSAVVFGVQAFVWWKWMPVVPTVPGAAPRFESGTSVFRYLVYLTVWIQAIIIAELVFRRAIRGQRGDQTDWAEGWRYLRRVATVALWLSAIGELLYIRDLIGNPEVLFEAIRTGTFVRIGESAREERLVGLSSLNNLFVIPVAVHSMTLFGQDAAAGARRASRRVVVGIGVAVLLHAFLFIGRQLFVTYVTIVGGAFLLSRGQRRLSARWSLTVVLVVVGLLWLGETARSGLYYARRQGVSAFSEKAQEYVGRRLVEAYFAADFNNAMVLLQCRPPYDLVNGTMWRTPAAWLGHEVTSYHTCPQWHSRFRTATIFSLWWWDLGWYGLIAAALLGGWLGGLYVLATDRRTANPWVVVLYLLTVPGIAAVGRINFFAETSYVLPLAFLGLAWLVRDRRPVRVPAWSVAAGGRGGAALAVVGAGLPAVPAGVVPSPPPAGGARPVRTEPRGATAGIPGVDPVACPYLGLAHDPATRAWFATGAHRCRAKGDGRPIPLDIQHDLCLSARFGQCPRFAAARQEKGRP
jgi:hypothetical protein